MKTLITLSICWLPTTGLLAQSAAKGSPEATPPWLSLKIHGKTASGSDELAVELLGDQGAAGSTGAKTSKSSPAPQDIQFRTKEGVIATLSGSHALALPGDLFTAAAPFPAKGAAPPSSNSMFLRYEQRFQPDGKRSEFVLRPQKGDSLFLAHIDRGERELISREILPKFRLSQEEVSRAVADVEGGSARRFWLPVTVTTSEGKWILKGGDKATVSHQGKCYQVRLYRSLRREPGTNPRIAFEGEKYLLSATVTLLKDCAQLTPMAK